MQWTTYQAVLSQKGVLLMLIQKKSWYYEYLNEKYHTESGSNYKTWFIFYFINVLDRVMKILSRRNTRKQLTAILGALRFYQLQ